MVPEMEGPGSALASATRAKLETACHGSLASEHSARFSTAASLVFCHASHSIERLALVREGQAR